MVTVAGLEQRRGWQADNSLSKHAAVNVTSGRLRHMLPSTCPRYKHTLSKGSYMAHKHRETISAYTCATCAAHQCRVCNAQGVRGHHHVRTNKHEIACLEVMREAVSLSVNM